MEPVEDGLIPPAACEAWVEVISPGVWAPGRHVEVTARIREDGSFSFRHVADRIHVGGVSAAAKISPRGPLARSVPYGVDLIEPARPDFSYHVELLRGRRSRQCSPRTSSSRRTSFSPLHDPRPPLPAEARQAVRRRRCA